jgi:hypothetical protein
MLVKLTPGFRDLYEVILGIESYRNDTFGMEDIFHQKTVEELNDTNNWTYGEIFTTLMGRCTKTCYKNKFKTVEFLSNIMYNIKKQRNFQVILLTNNILF